MPNPRRLSRVLNVRFTDEDYRQLERVAEAAGVKLSVAARLLTLWALLPEGDRHEGEDDDRAVTPVELLRSLAEDEGR